MPNHSITYGVEHDTSAAAPNQLKAATARRIEGGHRSAAFAQRQKATPMIAIVAKAQNAE
nr:hypothetical protein [Glycomyces arizonensis]